MTNAVAIIIAAVIIAGTVAYTFRYEVSGSQHGVYRLNRLTGAVILCAGQLGEQYCGGSK